MGCSGLYILRCTWAVFGCSVQLWAIAGCTGLCLAVLDCTGLYWAAPGCTGLYWSLLDLTGMNWDLIGWGGHWSGQVVQVVRMISIDDMHSENIWFSSSKSSNYRVKLRCHACDGRRKVENRAVFC